MLAPVATSGSLIRRDAGDRQTVVGQRDHNQAQADAVPAVQQAQQVAGAARRHLGLAYTLGGCIV
jgi:hypothetical protein